MSFPTPLLALPATLVLPPDLDQPILDELLELWNSFNPRDAFERLLVSRILQAVARLQISARRETEEADPLWLRYESAADRLFRQSLKALENHRLIHPIIASSPTKSAPIPHTSTHQPINPRTATPSPSRQSESERPTPNPSRVQPPPLAATSPDPLTPNTPTPNRHHTRRESQTDTSPLTSHSPRSLRSA